MGREIKPQAMDVVGTQTVYARNRPSTTLTVLQSVTVEELSGAVVRVLDNIQVVQTWTDVSGRFSIGATLVEVQDNVAVLRKADSNEIKVPVDKLSEESKAQLKK